VRTAGGEELRGISDPAQLPEAPFHLLGFFIDKPYPLDRSGFDLLARLTELSGFGLEHDDLTDADVLRFGRMPVAKRATQINFHGRNLTDVGLESLAGWPNLTAINYGHTRATWAGLDKLRGLKLKKLLFGNSPAGDAALAHLPLFPDLEHVDLEHTAVTDAGMAYLTRLPKLDGLVLSRNGITDAGLRALQKCGPALQRLYVRDTKVTPAGLREFHEARPDVALDPKPE
jgi:hypothetical protein